MTSFEKTLEALRRERDNLIARPNTCVLRHRVTRENAEYVLRNRAALIVKQQEALLKSTPPTFIVS